MKIFRKRGHWCYRQDGKTFKFATEAEAKSSLGVVELGEVENGSEEKEDSGKEKDISKKEDTSEEKS